MTESMQPNDITKFVHKNLDYDELINKFFIKIKY